MHCALSTQKNCLKRYYPYLTDENAEAWGRYLTHPRVHSGEVSKTLELLF